MKTLKNKRIRKHSSQRQSRLRRRLLRLESLEQRQLLAADLLFADSFEVGQWNGNWVEDSQNDWHRSTQRATDGSYSAEVDGRANDATLTMANPVDLTSYGSAELTYSWFIQSNWDKGEYIALDVYNGGWQEVDRVRGNVDAENVWHHRTINLDNYLNDDFKIRFRAKVSHGNEDGNVDNVKIVGTPAGSELAISDAQVVEGDSGTQSLEFVVTRSGNTSGTASVDYATVDGTATAGSDYTAASGTLNFAAGEISKTILVSVNGDTEIEPDEHFLLNLSNPIDATISDDQAVGTILDDDGDVTIAFPDFSDSAGLNLVGDAAIANGNTLRLTPAVEGMQGAAWYAADKQFAGVDWETTFDFNLNENFGDIGGSDGFAFIVQNYDPMYLRGGGGTLGYFELPNSIAVEFDTFQNSEVDDPSASHISVHTNGTGPNSWDESLSLGSFNTPSIMDDASTHTARIRYAAGTLSVFLDDLITPVLEVPVDLDQTLSLDAGKAWVGFTSATGGGYQNHDILNWTHKVLADTSTAIAVNDVTLIEGDSGTSDMIFTVTRTGATTGTTTVDWSTVDGTATAGSDYTAASGQVNFAVGETQQTISIAIHGDTLEEDNETFFVKLANVTGGIVVDGTGTGSIVNDDTSLFIADATAIEGDSSLKSLGAFVADGSGGLTRPRLSTFGPDANGDGEQDLYVSSADTDEILMYDGVTGAFIAPFVTAESPLDNPNALQFSPTDGDLYVSSAATDEVHRFDGQTGAYIDTPVSGLASPFGLTFYDDGRLLIANRGTNEVLLYDGSSLSVFVSAGSGGLDGPRRPAFGPDGQLYVTSANTSEILRYDSQTGAFEDVFATVPFGNITWLEFAPNGVAYATGLTTTECCDRSIATIDSTTGAVIDTLALNQDGWSFTVGPDGLVYSSGNSFGNHIDRIGPSSIAAFTVSLSKPSGLPVTIDFRPPMELPRQVTATTSPLADRSPSQLA